VDGAAASDVTPPNTRKNRRLRYDDDIINVIKPESNDIVLISPYLSIIGMTPAQYEPLVCSIIPSLSTVFDFNFAQGYHWHKPSCMPDTHQKWMALC
jgi:folate-dependent phosphoribosylglycinamide formyltransferase PurN